MALLVLRVRKVHRELQVPQVQQVLSVLPAHKECRDLPVLQVQ